MMNIRLSSLSSVVILLQLVTPRLFAQTWEPQQTNVPSHFSAVSFLDDQTGYVSGAYGVIFKTTDGGFTWIDKLSGTGLHFSDQFFVNADIGWVVGQNGVIMKTVDGGATWTPQQSGTTSWLNCVYFESTNTGWAAGANGTIMHTTNGGAIWTQQNSGTTATIEGGKFTSLTCGIMTCSDGSILKTFNGGINWSIQAISLSQSLNATCFATSLVGWVVGANGKIAKTTDGGVSWLDEASGTQRNLNAVAFTNVDTGWVGGDCGTIKRTTNGGMTWTDETSGTIQNLRSVCFISSSHGYAVGLNNTILEYAAVHAVPIQLASFVGTVLNASTVQLDWRTISEVNNYGFFVERSTGSSTNFVALNTNIIHGNGTTNEPQNYRFTDNTASTGRLYYRLRQVDLDGAVTYSEPITVDVLTEVVESALPVAFALKQNYPNPFNPSTKIEFSIATASVLSLKVYDMLGREVATILSGALNPGNYVKIFSGEGLSSGVYVYRLSAGNFIGTKRFVLAK